MNIIMKQNKFDTDMVELYTKNKEYLIAVAHIDNFSELLNNSYDEIVALFYEGGGLTLELKIKEEIIK